MNNSKDNRMRLNKLRNDLVFHNQKSAILIMALVISVLVVVLHGVVEPLPLYLWSLVCVAGYAVRYRLVHAYQMTDETQQSLLAWERRLKLAVLFSGVVWGGSALFIFPQESVIHQAILIVVVVLLGVATTVTHAAYSGLSHLFVLSSLPPLIIRLWFFADTTHAVIGIMLLLLLVVLLMAGNTLHKSTNRLFSLSRENTQLLDELNGRNQDLEKLNQSLQEAKESAEKANSTKTLFLANMSHEIRTPIHGISSMIQVMNHTRLSDEQKHYLETVERLSKSLMGLVDELLDLAKIEAGKLSLNSEPFDTLRWVMDMQLVNEALFDEGEVDFTTVTDDDLPPWLLGDSTRLSQVVGNLVANAAKFTSQGEVVLRVGGAYTDAEHYRLHITVEDSGIGIPAQKLDRIFDTYHQLSLGYNPSRGAGLGLAICKQLLSVMGGSVKVESKEGKGSCFTVELELPLSRQPETESAEQAGSVQRTRPLNLLVVDDDPISRMAVKLLYGPIGHQILEAENGQEALNQVQSHMIDLILMDVRMPVMDGVQATQAIRALEDQQKAALPIIGMSASVLMDERNRYLEAGMNTVVDKPVEFESLSGVIARFV